MVAVLRPAGNGSYVLNKMLMKSLLYVMEMKAVPGHLVTEALWREILTHCWKAWLSGRMQ